MTSTNSILGSYAAKSRVLSARRVKPRMFLFFSFLFQFSSVVDLQWCVSFRGTANESVIHISTLFLDSFPMKVIIGY